jgi:cellulose synthase/poly-beta-1,6-N-acetylglucosamine synthase-like glycosyltransferase
MVAQINASVMPQVQIFILARDRMEFCRETVASAIAQQYENFEVIVSDNSVNETVSQMLAKEFPAVRVIRRMPNLPALQHFNTLIAEATAPLLVLFHDDDILEPDYLSLMVSQFVAYPDITAAGCNARIIRGTKLTRQPFMGSFSGKKLLRITYDLLEPYLSLSTISPAPFPGYMYRTAMIQGLCLDAEKGGKHADVSFLGSVLARGPILWIDTCLMQYRFHGNNDSSQESIPNRLSWLRHIYATAGVHPKSRAVRDYKFLYWLKWYSQLASVDADDEIQYLQCKWRRKVVLYFIAFSSVRFCCTRMVFWERLARALKIRFFY